MTPVEHRAAARMAWRYARKAKARTALILFLIALPIAALVLTGIMISTVYANPHDKLIAEMGTADLEIFDQGPEAKSLDLTLFPRGTVVDSISGLTAYKVAGGTLLTLDITQHSVPPDEAPSAAKYKLLSGRMPRSAGEAALPPATARALGIGIGGLVRFDGLDRTLTIVGFSVVRSQFNENEVLVGPGTLDGSKVEGQGQYLVALPAGTPVDPVIEKIGRGPIGVGTTRSVLLSNASDEKRLTGFALAGAIVALFGTGMIVVTAIGVGARRQLRAHGLVEAAGGEPRHVRAIVIWGGALLGMVGSAIGVGVAIAAAYIVSPHINGLVNRVIETVRIPWWSITGGLVLGTAAAAIAALAPAKQAAQISAIDALAGRSPHPRAPGRIARRGAIGVLVGCLFTVIATITHEWTLLAIALVVTMTGFLLAIPILVSLVGRCSARFPATLRLAARQTARYGRRTGAAVAAATLALTAPIAVSTLILSHDVRDNRAATIGNDQMLLSAYAQDQPQTPQRLIDAVRPALPSATVTIIRFASIHVKQDPPVPVGGTDEASIQVSGPPPPLTHEITQSEAIAYEGGQLAIADADVLRAAHAETAIPYRNGDKLIAVGVPVDNGVLHLQVPQGVPEGSAFVAGSPSSVSQGVYPGTPTLDAPAISIRGGNGDPQTIPRYFIPEHLLRKYGLHASNGAQVLLRAPHQLTDSEIRRVKQAISLIPGGYAQAQRDLVLDSTKARLLITAAAMFLALIIVAVAVALVGAESRREQSILSAVGASPGVRRRMVGSNAFLMTALAGILAVPAGLVPMALILISERPRQPVPISWGIVAIVAFGAPAVAGLIATFASRAPKARAMLQPNW